MVKKTTFEKNGLAITIPPKPKRKFDASKVPVIEPIDEEAEKREAEGLAKEKEILRLQEEDKALQKELLEAQANDARLKAEIDELLKSQKINNLDPLAIPPQTLAPAPEPLPPTTNPLTVETEEEQLEKIKNSIFAHIDQKGDEAQKNIEDQAQALEQKMEEKISVNDNKFSDQFLNSEHDLNQIAQQIKNDGGTHNLSAKSLDTYNKIPHIIDPMVKMKKRTLGSYVANSFVGKLFKKKEKVEGNAIPSIESDSNVNESKKVKPVLDTKKIAEDLHAEIQRREASGEILTPEDKQALGEEIYKEAKKEFIKSKLENAGMFERGWTKFNNWWEKEDKGFLGKTAKTALSASAIGSAIIFSGLTIDYARFGHLGDGIARRVATRLAGRVGLATLLTTVLSTGFINEKVDKKFLKAGLMTLGLGASFMLGGLPTLAVAGSGIVGKEVFRYMGKATERESKEFTEKLERVKKNWATEQFNDGFDINTFANGLDHFETISRKQEIKTLWGKRIAKGGSFLISTLTGVATLGLTHQAVEHHTTGSDILAKAEVKDAIHKGVEFTKEASSKIWGAVAGDSDKEFSPETEHVAEEVKVEPVAEEPVTESAQAPETSTASNLSQTTEADVSTNPAETTTPTTPEEHTSHLEEVHEGGGGASQHLLKMDHDNYPSWFKQSVGEDPSAKDIGAFMNKVGLYHNDTKSSFIMEDGDKTGFDKDGNYVLERDGHTFTIAKPDGHGGFIKSDWEKEMDEQAKFDHEEHKAIELKKDIEEKIDASVLPKQVDPTVVVKAGELPLQVDPTLVTPPATNPEANPYHELGSRSGVIVDRVVKGDYVVGGNTTTPVNFVGYNGTPDNHHAYLDPSTKNHYDLLPGEIREVNDMIEKDLHSVLPNEYAWDQLKSLRLDASEMLKYDMSKINDTMLPFFKYLHHVENTTGIHPTHNFFKHEHFEEYLKRAGQYELAHRGSLENLKLTKVL